MDASFSAIGDLDVNNMFDPYIYKRNDDNLDVSLSVPQYNGQHNHHYNMGEQTFHTPSFGDEEFDIPTMNSHLQHHHQMDQYQMHNNGQPPPHMGMMNEQQQYNQWHQDSHLNHHNNAYSMQSPNQGAYHQIPSPNNNPQQQQQQMLIMQPPQQSPQMPPQMSPQMGGGVNFVGRSPPQNAPNVNSNEPGTTSDDSDDAIPTNTLKRPSPEPTYGSDSPNNSNHTVPAAKVQPALVKKPKVQKKKKKRDPNEPQKPVSAYALFFRDTQAAIKGQNPNASFGEVSKIVASMWDVLATEHKNVYKKKTEAAKKEYLKALAAYRASLVSKGTEGDQQQSQQQPMYSPPPPMQSQNQQQQSQQQNSHLVTHPQQSPQHGPPVPQVSPHMPMQGQAGQMPPQQNSYQPPYASPYKSPQQTMMQMQQHPQHHPQHGHPQMPQQQPGHLIGQMNPMSQQQMLMQQQQQQQMNQSMNGMMGMGMTPPQPHYMNQQIHSQQQPPQQQQHPQQPPHPMQAGGGHISPHNAQPPPVSGSPTQQNPPPQQCIRHGCPNQAIVNSDWEDEYCSNECVITHCRDVFGNWVQTNNNQQQQTFSAVK